MEKIEDMSTHQFENSSATSPPSDEDIEPVLHWRTWAAVAAACTMLFADNFGVVSTGNWLVFVIGTLGDAENVIWFAEAFIVVQSALMPIIGMWMDFGAMERRWMTIVFGLLAAMGLIVAGAAKTMNIAIIGASFFGFSVINYATCFAIVSEVLPHRMKGLGQGILFAMTALGAVAGSLIGGVFVQHNTGGAGGWRWSLYLAGILHAAASVAIYFFYRPLPSKIVHTESYMQRLGKLDWLGSFLFAAGWVPLMVGISNGGNSQLWKAPANLVPIVVGGCILIVFGLHQIFVRKDGVLNHRLFRHRNFALALMGITCEGAFLIPFNAYEGQFVAILYEKRPVHDGLHAAVLWLSSMVVSLFCGWYSKTFRRVKEPIIVGWVLILVGLIGLSRAKADVSDDKLVYGMICLLGMGLGVQLSLLVTAAQLAVPPDLIGICSALFTGIRSMGAVIGITIATAVYTAKLNKNIPDGIASAAAAAGVPSAKISALIGALAGQNATALAGLGLTPAQEGAGVQGLLNGYAASFPFVWYVIMAFVCTMLIGSFFLADVKHMMNWVIDHAIEKEEDLGIIHPVEKDEKASA